MKKIIPILILLACLVSRASVVSFQTTNSITGLPDTNSFKVFACSSVSSAGTVYTIGLPILITPDTNGYAQHWFEQNNYLVTNAYIRTYLFRAPLDSSTNNIYPSWTYPCLLSGLNYFVNTVITNGGSATVTLNSITNALGYQPLSPAQTTNVTQSVTNGMTSIVYSNSISFLTPAQGTNLVNGISPTFAQSTNISQVQASNIVSVYTPTNWYAYGTNFLQTNLSASISTQGLAATNFTLSASNSVYTNLQGQILGSSNTLASFIGASNAELVSLVGSTSNALQNGKQPASTTLSNLSLTGAFTNQLQAGTNVVLSTNPTAPIVYINVPIAQQTNGFGTAVYMNRTEVMTNNSPSIKLGAIGTGVTLYGNGSVLYISNALNNAPGYISMVGGSIQQAGSFNDVYGTVPASTNIATKSSLGNMAYSNSASFYPVSNPSNYVSLSIVSGLASTNYVQLYSDTNGAAQAAVSSLNYQSGSLTLSNLAQTGAFTNTFAAGTNVVLSTNLTGPIIYINAPLQTQLTNGMILGSLVSNLVNTAAQNGTNFTIAATNGLVSTIIPAMISQNGAGITNFVNASLLVTSNGIVALIPSTNGLASTNFVNYQIFITSNWLQSSIGNLSNSIVQPSTNFMLSGVVGSWTTNNIFSSSGTNIINALAYQQAALVITNFSGPTNGITAGAASNIVLTYGGTLYQPIGNYQPANANLTNWASIGTNLLSLSGVVSGPTTNNSFSTAGTNAIDFEATNVAIAKMSGFGTNTTLRSGIYFGVTNLTVHGTTWLNNSNMVISILNPATNQAALIPLMTSSNTPSGLAEASSYVSGSDPFNAFGAFHWRGAEDQTNWLKYTFSNVVTVSKSSASFLFGTNGQANEYGNVEFQYSLDNTNWSDIWSNQIFVSSFGKTDTFTNITAKYFRWFLTKVNFTLSNACQISSAQLYSPAVTNSLLNIISNFPALEIISSNGAAINTNNPGTNALRILGDLDVIGNTKTSGTSTANIVNGLSDVQIAGVSISEYVSQAAAYQLNVVTNQTIYVTNAATPYTNYNGYYSAAVGTNWAQTSPSFLGYYTNQNGYKLVVPGLPIYDPSRVGFGYGYYPYGQYALLTNFISGGYVTADYASASLQGYYSADAASVTNQPLVTNSTLYRIDNLIGNNANLSGAFSGNGSSLSNLNSANLTGPISPTNLPTSVVTNYTSQQFGMQSGNELLDVSCTNGSAQIYSPSAAWTLSDIGKGCVLYLDSTNRTWLRTTIASVQNSTHITLSANSTATRTPTSTPNSGSRFVYGADNCSSISNAIWTIRGAGGGKLLISQGIFCLWQDPHNAFDSAGSYCVIQLPDNHGTITTNSPATVEIEGATWAAAQGITFNSNPPAMTGTILYYVGQPTNSANMQEVFGQNVRTSVAPGSYAVDNMVWRNITFRQPVNPRVWWFNLRDGGGANFEKCAFDTEYPIGFQIGQTVQFQPTNTVVDFYAPGAVWFPAVNNDSRSTMVDCWVYNYPCGVRAYEHLKMSRVNIHWCGTAIDQEAANVGPIYNSCHLLGNTYDLAVTDVGLTAYIPMFAYGIEGEDYAYSTTIYDPSNRINGIWQQSGGDLTKIGGANLNIFNNNAGSPDSYYTLSSLSHFNSLGKMQTELGSSPHMAGLILDLDLSSRFQNSGDTDFFYDRSRSGLSATIPRANYDLTNSIDGYGILSRTGGKLSIATNSFHPILTNVTVDILVCQTNTSITYPMTRGSGLNDIQIFCANGGVGIGWKTTTINGTVTAQVSKFIGDGRWHEITGVYDGNTSSLYVDGILSATAAQTGIITNAQDALIFGGRQNDQIAHPRIWSRAFSAQEVRALATSRGIVGPENASLFLTLNSATLTFTNSVNSPFVPDTVQSQTLIGYDTSTGGMMITNAGLYHISCSMRVTGGSASWQVYAYKNSTLILGSQANSVASNQTIGLDGSVNCVAGDVIYIKVWQNSGADKTITGGTAPFWQWLTINKIN